MPSREQVALKLEAALISEYGDEGWRELGSLRRITLALMPLFEQARNEALEEAAQSIRNYFGDYDRQRIRALKTGGGGSSG